MNISPGRYEVHVVKSLTDMKPPKSAASREAGGLRAVPFSMRPIQDIFDRG